MTEQQIELGIEDRAPELVPLNAIFATGLRADLARSTTANTMAEVAAAVAHHVEGKRCAHCPTRRWSSTTGGSLPAEMTVAEAGIAPLEPIAVEYDTPEGQS